MAFDALAQARPSFAHAQIFMALQINTVSASSPKLNPIITTLSDHSLEGFAY
jgi:hypothetical protein